MNEVEVKITDIINSTAAVSADDGTLIFNVIDKAFSSKQTVLLDFSDIDILITAFLNAAIGQLYSKYDSETLNKYLKPINIDSSDIELLKRTIQRAKEYFADKEEADHDISEVL